MTGVVAAIGARTSIEIRQYVRQRDALFFTFLMPPMLLVVFASAFGDRVDGTDVRFAQYFLAGIVGSIGLNVGFSGAAGMLAADRSTGAVKRLVMTPMPWWAYAGGKVALLLVSAIGQLVLLLAIGRWVYGLQLPAGASDWFTIAWVLLLGLGASSLAGVAYSRLIRDVDSINAVVAPVVVVLPFVSGVYFVFSELPGWMQTAGSLFPLRWMTLGMRSAFLPDSFASIEPGGTWQLGSVAAVLAVWLVVAGGLAMRGLRPRTSDT